MDTEGSTEGRARGWEIGVARHQYLQRSGGLEIGACEERREELGKAGRVLVEGSVYQPESWEST